MSSPGGTRLFWGPGGWAGAGDDGGAFLGASQQTLAFPGPPLEGEAGTLVSRGHRAEGKLELCDPLKVEMAKAGVVSP